MRFSLVGRVLPLVVAGSFVACGNDFDTTRKTPPRGSVGRELYSLVCDRVAAQAIREDVQAQSWHGICHQAADGTYWEKVKIDKIPPIRGVAYNVNGDEVSVEQQQKHRKYRVARIEALAKRREELIGAFDVAFPDELIAVRDLGNPDPAKSCGVPLDKNAQRQRFLSEVADALSRMTDLYNDGTFPRITGALGRMMKEIEKDKGVQDALARVDARQGYRPAAVAIGVARPLLSYPRLVDLGNALLKAIASDSDPYSANKAAVPGVASAEFRAVLQTLHEELRTATSDPPIGSLAVKTDTTISREILSRPRSTLELSRAILLAEDPKFGLDSTVPRYIAKRDSRGVAVVPLEGTNLPSLFVDSTGDKLPDLNELGQFVTAGGVAAPTPFFTVEAVNSGIPVPRDTYGRALKAAGSPDTYYGYVDTSRTFAATLVKDFRPLFETDPAKGKETVMKLLAGVPVVLGKRDEAPTAEKTYPPDPSLVDNWKLARKDAPPKNLGTQPVTLKYRAFDPNTSPIVDLVYALGQILARQEMDDTLAVFSQLTEKNPQLVARLVGLGLQAKAIADKHPEAKIPGKSTLWDEMLDTVVKIAQAPGVLEDVLRAFANDKTLKLDQVFAAYIKYKDELTYDRNDLNGAPWNVTTSGKVGLVTPVDRTGPDSGKNRSALQRFMQMLHDANGLAACTKDNAVAHVSLEWPAGSGIKINVNYPTDRFISGAMCAFVGKSAPTKLPLCGVLRLENVAALLLDVALGRAKFDVRDPCLDALMRSPLSAIVGGVDKFLEDASGIKGFSTKPTVPGVARMVHFDVAHDGLPGDTKNQKTNTFLGGVLDPVPTMVCPLAPFTDSDGKVIPLRNCKDTAFLARMSAAGLSSNYFDYTIRGRDDNALFPLELMGFVESVSPLAAAFADHNQPLLFVELFDTLHRHWGSPKQSKAECDPTVPKTDARWCSQDGTVTYEALLAEVLETDLFPTLYEAVKALQATKINHCDAFDATTKQCTSSRVVDGVQVLAEAVRVLVDPNRNAGLTNRRGEKAVLRTDGVTSNPQVTPLYLFIDALKAIDTAFDNYADKTRLQPWREARSELVDQLFAVEGAKATAQFKNPAISKILPKLLGITRAQIAAQCPNPKAPCTWASKELTERLTNSLKGPTAASLIDLLDAIRRDDPSRIEIEKLIAYLLDGASDNDAQATTLMAAVDLLQVLEDDVNLEPLYRVMASAAAGPTTDEKGNVVLRGLLDGSVQGLARLFARAYDKGGAEICSKEIDPNRTIDFVMKRMLLPYGKDGKDLRTPIETIISVVADVNRADPMSQAKLAGDDYRNISKEIAEFCLHPERGLVQIYEVIRQATANK